jgi:hypothetical protein
MAHGGTSGISLHVRGLSKAFRGTWALRALDLDLRPGGDGNAGWGGSGA